MSAANDSIDAELDAMRESAAELLRSCHFRSAMDRNAQTARLAKSHQKLIPFLYARFHQMDQAQYVLEPAQMRDCAIELIPLLEDEERARAFQADFDASYYEGTRDWMTACLYENLAEATGLIGGFNSAGMHQCIADGLQVCRRTGKLACIQCFREYACDVYTAAEDLTMARHQCQSVIGHTGPWSDRGDRRWFAECKLSSLNLLDGNVAAAMQACERALELVKQDDGPLQLESTLRSMVDLETSRVLAGLGLYDWNQVQLPAADDRMPSENEWPALHLRRSLNVALQHSVAGEDSAAIQILKEWDRTLKQQQCGTAWFDVRLRLIAALQRAGQLDRIDRLAVQLKEAATKAADFLTLCRLQRLMDPTVPANPLAGLRDFQEGVFAAASADVGQDRPGQSAEDEIRPDADSAGQPDSPNAVAEATRRESAQPDAAQADEFKLELFELVDAYASGETEEQRRTVVERLLAHQPDQVRQEESACMLLHFGRMMVPDADPETQLTWAESFTRAFPESGSVLSLYAALCHAVHQQYADGSAGGPGPDLQQIESLFGLALTLDPEQVGVHLLAGEFFHAVENHGEAERCLARAFRLDRTNISAVLRLSEVYQETERPRDALAVLDMCLREGVESPNVAWEAMIQAVHLGQFEASLSYADLFDRLEPGEAGVNYYRSLAFVELGRAQEALQAVDQELQFSPEDTLHLDAVRCAAFQQLQRENESRDLLEQLLRQPYGSMDFLTHSGISQALDLIYRTTQKLPPDDSLRERWQQRLLRLNLMPDEVFTSERAHGDVERVNFYQLLVRQPLPDNWGQSAGCLPGQQSWTVYHTVWGVLATDEQAACEIVLRWQNQCEDLSAEVQDIALDGEDYQDHAGVAWQGPRWNPTADNESAADHDHDHDHDHDG